MVVYQTYVHQHISNRSKARPVVVCVITLTIMTISVIWYNILLQYYYIVHLKSVRPSSSTYDKYFPAVNYTSSILNELNFCLLIGICVLINRFL